MDEEKKQARKVRLYMHSIEAAKYGKKVFHGFTLSPTDIYGQDSYGYFVFSANCVGYDESGKVVAMLYRLCNHEWAQVIYTDATKAPVFAQIASKYGLFEMRYKKSTEKAKEIRQGASNKEANYRYVKQRGTGSKDPKYAKEYNEGSVAIYGEYVYFGNRKRKVHNSVASYMDGIMKKK